MAGKRGDKVRTEFYDPQFGDKFAYANNPSLNRLQWIEWFYRNQLTQMAANRFTWTGLPKEIPVRFLELTLVRHGLIVFFEETEKYGEYMAMRAGSMGPRNVYDDPTSFTVHGGEGNMLINQTLDIDECVPIWSNYMRVADERNIRLWAIRLADIDYTIELSFQNARQTKFIGVPENLRHSAEQVLKQMIQGVPAVFGTEELAQIVSAIQTIDLESHPSKLMNLLISKAKVWNEIMTFMGVNNSNQDKKERLVQDEVSANDEQVDLAKQMFLATRQHACEQIKEKFGLDVTVEFNQSQDLQIQGAEQGISANAVPNDRSAPMWGN